MQSVTATRTQLSDHITILLIVTALIPEHILTVPDVLSIPKLGCYDAGSLVIVAEADIITVTATARTGTDLSQSHSRSDGSQDQSDTNKRLKVYIA